MQILTYAEGVILVVVGQTSAGTLPILIRKLVVIAHMSWF